MLLLLYAALEDAREHEKKQADDALHVKANSRGTSGRRPEFDGARLAHSRCAWARNFAPEEKEKPRAWGEEPPGALVGDSGAEVRRCVWKPSNFGARASDR